MIRIERAEPADAAALLHLHRSILAEERWFVATKDELLDDLQSRSHRISEYARSDNSLWLVARDGGSIVGSLTLTGGAWTRVRHVARLDMMISQSRRGSGLGTRMLDAGLSWARNNPMLVKVSLNVFDDNPRAIALYDRMGFAREGARPHEYRDPDGRLRGDVLMALDVRANQGSST